MKLRTIALFAGAAVGLTAVAVTFPPVVAAAQTVTTDCGEDLPGPSRSEAYLQIVADGGVIDGDGPNHAIVVHGVRHEVITPHDPVTGQVLGEPIRDLFTFTKSVDRASPLLMGALVNDASIDSARFDFVGANGRDYTIELMEARIIGFSTRMTKRCAGDYVHLEEISLLYKKITYTHSNGGTTFTDNVFPAG